MKHFRIQMNDQADRTRGFGALVREYRVVCYRDNQFVVPEAALSLLDEMGVSYSLLREEDPDLGPRAVRNPAATSL